MTRQYNFTNRKFGKRNPIFGIFASILFAFVLGGGAYFYFNTDLEYQSPVVSINHTSMWNQKTPLQIGIEDNGSGVKHYRISYSIGDSLKTLAEKELTGVHNKVYISLHPKEFPKTASKIQLTVEATDGSKWNLTGNHTVQVYELLLDNQPPEVSLVSHSYSITRGGGATIVAKIVDQNLGDYKIKFNNDLEFKMFPFYKDGYFMSIIPWPVHIAEFKSVSIVASDKAGNVTNVKVPLFVKELKYKVDKIQVSDEFVQSVTMKVLELTKSQKIEDATKAFLYTNNKLRQQNIQTLMALGSKIDTSVKRDFALNPFSRLPGSATLANFADKRIYYKDDAQIDEQWHLGTDWASTKEAPIYTSNDGVVVFNDYLGIYGNTIVIDHGFGIMSLYAHTSSQDVKVGQSVKAGQKIGKTGATGAVFGDHLHFGILIQGYESDTKEWLDKAWIDVRVKEILDEAKRKIDNK